MKSALLLAVLATLFCRVHAGFEEGADEDTSYLAAVAQNVNKTLIFHWLISVLLLVVVPSFGAVFVLAGRLATGISIQALCAVYAAVEALILRFPDPSGEENVTSRGTAWFLAFFYCVTLLSGSVATGSSLFADKIGFVGPKIANIVYKVFSVLLVLCGFLKSGMAVVSALGFCYGLHTGQCNAHGIMGTAFIGYGFLLSMVLVVPWLRHGDGQKRSQEFYDSIMITIWGIINTFTEHRPWEPWSHGDYQHTSMGIIFWACGMLGIWLSRNNRRNPMPALTLMFTAYAMSQHAQHMQISTKVHAFFGWVLMLGGFARIWEITFLLQDQRCHPSGKIMSFQYLPPFSLVLAGITFMGANEEQLKLVMDMGADHSSYVLVLTSAACLVELWFLGILELYLRLVGYTIYDQNHYDAIQPQPTDEFELHDFSDLESNRETPSEQ
ncbi:Protein YTP1 [Ogataea parapolymorpha DL-1]|uniref:Protein YTP1 n=1 Tax=Ogataea parapolymorpha (strain ATCC 26012 / BCRC 20466 / JCM 22074 / NRRL Y-7560 / DL-1) TaxID=871575 RepID=W1QCG8_OGAPD|nr:Protein YTP1 [Ogataea parapolymorpha DL-1]ESW98229.1 Protein YTP1 [Ogataea parapolymorpha DL-1]